MEQRIQQAYSFSGYLEKKSPAMLKGWQKRFFQIRDSGQLLLYYAKEPTDTKTKAKGIVPILSIEAINPLPHSKVEFMFKVQDRDFHLKAPSDEVRQKWIDTLIFLKELKTKEEQTSIDLQSTQNMPASGEETTRAKNKQQKVDWSELDADTMNRIKLEEEQAQYNKISRQIEDKNEEVLRAKGIYAFISKYDREVVERHVISGFLMKKGKLAKLTVAKKRWFFMVSSVVINGEKDENSRINQADIPSVFKLDNIYYFAYDSVDDKSNFIDKIILDDCERPEIMSLDKNQFIESLQIQKLPYGLTLSNNKSNRTYSFFSEHLTEIHRWVNAIIAVQSRPNKGVSRRSKIGGGSLYLNQNGQDQGQSENTEEENQFVEEEILFESQVQKKHQNKLLTGPLSWKTVTLQLKKTSLYWTAGQKDDDSNLYVLLFNITRVEGANRSWVVYTNDAEYKFKDQTPEKKDIWVKKIKEQVEAIKGTINEDDLKVVEKGKNQEDANINKAETSDEDDSDYVTKVYYKKMALSMDKSQKNGSLNDDDKPSFFSRIFGCCDGRPDDEETDRGF